MAAGGRSDEGEGKLLMVTTEAVKNEQARGIRPLQVFDDKYDEAQAAGVLEERQQRFPGPDTRRQEVDQRIGAFAPRPPSPQSSRASSTR